MFEFNCTPSLDDIADGLQYNKSTIYYHFRNLIDAGYIIEIKSGHYYLKGFHYECDKEVSEIESHA